MWLARLNDGGRSLFSECIHNAKHWPASSRTTIMPPLLFYSSITIHGTARKSSPDETDRPWWEKCRPVEDRGMVPALGIYGTAQKQSTRNKLTSGHGARAMS